MRGEEVSLCGAGVILRVLLSFCLLSSVFYTLPAFAAGDSPWEITADQMWRFDNPATVIAEGNVVLVRQGDTVAGLPTVPEAGVEPATPKPLTITGDWLRLDPVNNIIKVRGHAVLDSDDEHITADAATLQMDQHTGILKNATLFFPKRSLYLAGREVEKTGELTYHFVDGWVTKCDPETGKAPPWSFTWTSGNVTYEGFAHFINATFRVKDVPVAYSPYFAFSTNKRRKTGVLLPEISDSGRDGTGILLPLFVNLSPSSDATLYAGYLADRGTVLASEFRYVRDYNSKGTLAINYLDDGLQETATDDFKSDGILRSTKNRYWLRGKADHDFGDSWNGKIDLDLVSDRDYLQEYQDGIIGFDQNNLDFKTTFSRGFDSETTYVRSNTAQLSKSWTDMSLNSELRVVNDSSATRSTHHLWTLPKVNFSGRTALIHSTPGSTGIREFVEDTDLTWDSQYVYYWREAGVGSHRLDMHPQLKAPLRLTPYLETTATVGVRETLYSVDDNSEVSAGFDSGILSRTLQDYNITTSTIFQRDFKVNLQSFEQLTHMIRPQVSYDYIPIQPQTEFPSLDGVDRISATNLVTYQLVNDFDLSSKGINGTQASRKYAYMKLIQSYNIKEQRRELSNSTDKHHPFSVITGELDYYPFSWLTLNYETDLNVYGEGFTRYELRSRYSAMERYSLGLEYRYTKGTTINQLNVDTSIGLSEYLSMLGAVQYSFFDNRASEATMGLYYRPACWSMQFLAATTPDNDYSFRLVFALEDIGKVLGISQTLYSLDGGGHSFKDN